MTTLSTKIDAEICRRAIERLGCVDAMIFRDTKREKPGVDDHGLWYGLFVRPEPGDEWQLVGRRRTRDDRCSHRWRVLPAAAI